VRVCWSRSHRAARRAGEEKPGDPSEPPGGSGRCIEQTSLGISGNPERQGLYYQESRQRII
jgi:hypothetical protein